FQPDHAPGASASVEPAAAAASSEKGRPGDAIKGVLDRLVANGTITAAQRDAIVASLADLQPRRDGAPSLKRIVGDLVRLSGEYLGLGKEELRKRLADGSSLGEIADATAGKSKSGLVDVLVGHADAKIGEALGAGTITAERAERLRTAAREHVAKLVDRKLTARPAKTRPAIDVKRLTGDFMAGAASYLGIAPAELRKQLAEGRSLGEIAGATAGKSTSGLVSALTAGANAKIDAAQAAGTLTAEQAATAKTRAAEAIARIVEAKRSPATR
ncbi:MAG: hypothetical protein ACRDF0_09995, partial [Candidatus Limnocylindria bacterium]